METYTFILIDEKGLEMLRKELDGEFTNYFLGMFMSQKAETLREIKGTKKWKLVTIEHVAGLNIVSDMPIYADKKGLHRSR